MDGKGALKYEISSSRNGVRNICGVVCLHPGSCNIHTSLGECKHLFPRGLWKIMVEGSCLFRLSWNEEFLTVIIMAETVLLCLF